MPEIIEQSTAIELFEAAPCGYLFSEPDGTITRVNETFLRWTGYSSPDLVAGKRFQDLLSVPAKIFYETHLSPLLRMQGFVKEITVDIVCANGDMLPALVNSTVQEDASGRAALIRTTVFDIRERRRYERELLLERRKAEQLSEVVKNSSDAILTLRGDLIVSTWNRGAQLLFGYTMEETVGRDIRNLIIPRDSIAELEFQLATLKSGKSVITETHGLNKAGELIAVSSTMTPTIDPPNEFVGFSISMRDVRARQKAERALQIERELALANYLAHEINNPLQAVVNCLSILSTQGHSEYVQLAEEQLNRVARVVIDLMKITRTDRL